MAAPSHPNLLSPLRIGQVTLRNRMVFTAHDSLLAPGFITDAYIAYQLARTRGGAGLQILTASTVVEGSGTFEFQLRLDCDEAVPGFRRIAEAIHAEGGTVFAQLIHAGREIYSSADGCQPVTYSASATRSERSHIVPRELSKPQIADIVKGYAAAARRAVSAGLDGVEICGNQGNLPAQFLAAYINRRTDEYGGSLENRTRFLLEVCAAVRAEIGPNIAFGVRLSVDDLDNIGLNAEESVASLQLVDRSGLVDFIHVVLGTGSSRAGAFHIVAPMTAQTGYMEPYARKVKAAVGVPVLATGRFNTPQAAEAAIANGAADAIGMTRAMICDPQLGRKVAEQRLDDVRACIACDQACIGHLQRGYSVSCIQYPESGRELTLGQYGPAERPKRILVAGGGPAGMKAAAVAAARGHQVVLCEASGQLGGQALLAAQVVGRTEFGGIVTNLSHEMEVAGVEVRLRTKVDRALVEAERPDAIILAVGGRPVEADDDSVAGMQVLTGSDVIRGNAKIGGRVVIADRMADWTGYGAALQLAASGHQVTLALTGAFAGEGVPSYVSTDANARLFEAGVKVIPFVRFFGADDTTVYFEHVGALKPMLVEDIDTLVVCFGGQSDRGLEAELAGLEVEQHIIGDCLSPRTAEEAVLDALKVARRL